MNGNSNTRVTWWCLGRNGKQKGLESLSENRSVTLCYYCYRRERRGRLRRCGRWATSPRRRCTKASVARVEAGRATFESADRTVPTPSSPTRWWARGSMAGRSATRWCRTGDRSTVARRPFKTRFTREMACRQYQPARRRSRVDLACVGKDCFQILTLTPEVNFSNFIDWNCSNQCNQGGQTYEYSQTAWAHWL